MSRYHAYLNSASEIIQHYGGSEPLSSFLKKYFSRHKKHGSKDRKFISHLCYCYFRTGGLRIEARENKLAAFAPSENGEGLAKESISIQILVGLFLCSTASDAVLERLAPAWNEKVALPFSEKISMVHQQLFIENVFPWKEELSKEIVYESFVNSFFIQPLLFLRLRPGQQNAVRKKLQKELLPFSDVSKDCLALPNASGLDDVLQLNREAVVQDLNSQRIADFFPLFQPQTPTPKLQTFSAWDCCAASGGKSILLRDYFPKAQLTVSDVRESILHNLKSRFKQAGINSYQSFVADISSPQFQLDKKFDVIICDAPCSGSGTWARTPENLRFFSKEKIDYYASLQKSIAANASKCLKNGGAFLYITCSVFKKENEEVVDYLLQQTSLRSAKQQYFKGYNDKADTLFAALFVL